MKTRSAGACPGTGIALVAMLTLGVATSGLAQGVIKCVDAEGNTTYQDSACAGGQAGRAVTLPKAESRDDSGAWEAAAKEARVLPGMPKRWVLRARGAPLEIRPGAARENATEVWRYKTREGMTLVGFAGPDVAWQRDEAKTETETELPKGPAELSIKGAQNRRFVLPGRYCEHVFAEIGVADRQEPLSSPATGIRHVYEPQAGDASMRTSFSCVGGKVADVERVMVR